MNQSTSSTASSSSGDVPAHVPSSESPSAESTAGSAGETSDDSVEGSSAPSPPAPSPTVRRRVLAAELKGLRHAAQLTHIDVAHRLGWQQGKVSKIESARQGVPVEVVIALAELCRAAPEHRDRLVEMAKAARVRPWWESYGDMLTPDWKTYLGLETDADAIELFSGETLPELFQTADYASQVISARLTAEESQQPMAERANRVRRSVDILRERQRNAFELRKVVVDGVISESALLRGDGGDRTLREQLTHLVQMAGRPNVNLRVLPFSAGPLIVAEPFTVFRFREEPHPDAVFVPHRFGAIHLEQQQEVDVYHAILRELRTRSWSTEKSLQLLQRLSHADEPRQAIFAP